MAAHSLYNVHLKNMCEVYACLSYPNRWWWEIWNVCTTDVHNYCGFFCQFSGQKLRRIGTVTGGWARPLPGPEYGFAYWQEILLTLYVFLLPFRISSVLKSLSCCNYIRWVIILNINGLVVKGIVNWEYFLQCNLLIPDIRAPLLR
jgi:hypothetical protein